MGLENSKVSNMGSQLMRTATMNEYCRVAAHEDHAPHESSAGNYKNNIFIGQPDDKFRDDSILFKSSKIPLDDECSLKMTGDDESRERSVWSSIKRDFSRRNLHGLTRKKSVKILSNKPSKFYTKEDIALVNRRSRLLERSKSFGGFTFSPSEIVLSEVETAIRPGDYVLVTVRPKPGMPKYPMVVRPMSSPPQDVVDSLKKYSWYLGGVTRDEANYILKDAKPGTYMVRNSTTYPEEFALSIKVTANERPIKHYMIEHTGKGYTIWGKLTFPTISELIETYKKRPYGFAANTLLYPCSEDENAMNTLYGELDQIWRKNYATIHSKY